MSWFRLNQGAPDDERVKLLGILLDVDADTALARSVRLWDLGFRQSVEGCIAHITPMRLAVALNHRGDPRELVDALVESGLLQREGGLLLVDGWRDMWGRVEDRRQANAERMRKKREEEVQRTCSARAAHVQRTEKLVQERAAHVQHTCIATDGRTDERTNGRTDDLSHVQLASPGGPEGASPSGDCVSQSALGLSQENALHLSAPHAERHVEPNGATTLPPFERHPQGDPPPVPAPPPPATGKTPKGCRVPREMPGWLQEEFQRWYGIYPRREARAAAEKAFLVSLRAIPATEGPIYQEAVKLFVSRLVAATERQIQLAVFSHERRYIPLPGTWLSQRRWEDDVVTPPPIAKPPEEDKMAFAESWYKKRMAKIEEEERQASENASPPPEEGAIDVEVEAV